MQQSQFMLSRNVKINTDITEEPVKRAILRFYRDLKMVLEKAGYLQRMVY